MELNRSYLTASLNSPIMLHLERYELLKSLNLDFSEFSNSGIFILSDDAVDIVKTLKTVIG